MNKLTEYLVEGILQENASITKKIVVFAGRFQPFHKGHYFVYEYLSKTFGKDNVYIATSNMVEKPKSPFSFKEKKNIMTKMFRVPVNKVVQVKSPYSPVEVLKKFDKDTTAYITAVSRKDGSRLGGKYFKEYSKKTALKGYGEEGYFVVTPVFKMDVKGQNVSGTAVRGIFGGDYSDSVKEKMFKMLFGKMDNEIYGLLTSRLTEAKVMEDIIRDYVKNSDVMILLNETTTTLQGSNADVDDGPNYFYGNLDSYRSNTARRAARLGYTVVDFILNPDTITQTDNQAIYPTGPVGDVSFAPTGVAAIGIGNERPEHTHLEGIGAFAMWDEHIKRMAEIVGYDIIDYLGARRVIDDVGTAAYKALIKKTRKELRGFITNLEKYDKTPPLKEELLKEGGAYGHMQHPFENQTLTFGDIKGMINDVLSGSLKIVQEKLDGQNLMITFHNGKIRSARLKKDMKGFGKNALNLADIKKKFSGRGEITKAFVGAMEDLNSAISQLSSAQQEKIFGNGKRYMNIEILYPGTTNTIPYGLNMIMFHGMVEVDEDGNVVSSDTSFARILGGMLKQINVDVQKTFTLASNPTIKYPKIPDFKAQRDRLVAKVDKLGREFNLKNNTEVIEYHKSWWKNKIEVEAKKRKYSISTKIKNGLIDRWALGNKRLFTVNDIKKQIDHESFRVWALAFDKNEHQAVFKKNIGKFELIFLELGAVILRNLSDILVVKDFDSSVKSIRDKINKTISQLESTKDFEKLEKAKEQLAKLDSIGGLDAVIPSEGLVFLYKGSVYKLTGTFTPIHHTVKYLTF